MVYPALLLGKACSTSRLVSVREAHLLVAAAAAARLCLVLGSVAEVAACCLGWAACLACLACRLVVAQLRHHPPPPG